MNAHSFSILGYLSVLLWLAVPLLFIFRRRFPTPGWLPLVLAVAAYLFAAINSRTHVSRIETAVPEEVSPDALMLAAEKRKALEKARSGEVADIRFAEDGNDDFIDKAGMDDADRKYTESLNQAEEPEWKKQKKQRGEANAKSDEFDDMLAGEESTKKLADAELPQEKEPRPPILMPEADATTARLLDRLNRSVSSWVIFLGFILLIVDYLTRANIYARAGLPLPFPASLRNAFTPLPAIVTIPEKPRRTLAEELAHLTRRGDVFLCFTNDLGTIPESLPKYGKNLSPIEVIRVEGHMITPELIFECLWYGRASFVADAAQAKPLLTALLAKLAQRQSARARARQNIHLVWDLKDSMSPSDREVFQQLASTTGFSLLLYPSK